MIPLLHRTARALFVIAVLGAAAACGDNVNAPRPARKAVPGAVHTIWDGAHNGGNDDVFFLPPMVANPVNQPGYGDPFQPGLPVEIQLVCVQAASGSACPTVDFPPSTVTVDQTNEFYMVNFDTKTPGVDPGDTYRVEVIIGSKVVAYADVLLLSTGKGKNVATGDSIPLVDSRTMPIKVRVEKGWNCTNNSQCVSQVVGNTPVDQPITVITNDGSAAAQFSGNWIPYCQTGQTTNCVPQGTQVIVTIEDQTATLNAPGPNGQPPVTCSLIQDGTARTHMLSQPAHCVKFTTDPQFQFAHSVKVAVCVETDDPTQQLLKYDFHETPIFLLNVPFYVNGVAFTALCEQAPPTVGSRSSNPAVQLALTALSRVGSAIRDLVTPKSAYAIHLGVGGLVDSSGAFSYVSPGHALTMSAAAGDGQSATAGQAVANPVQVRITTMHGLPSASYPSPVANLPVSCQVASGGGSLGTAGTTQAVVTTDATGLASCPSWILGANAGTNTLHVTTSAIDGGILAVEDGETGPDSIPMNASVTFSATGTATIAAPALAYTSSAQYTTSNGELTSAWDRYSFTVTNLSTYSASLFAPRSGATSCASQTEVDFFDAATNNYIYGFCGLSSPSDLNGIWFAVPRWTQPPAAVYIEFIDATTRAVIGRSNTVSLYGPLFTNYPRQVELDWSPVAGSTGYQIEVDFCQSWQTDWRNCNTDWQPLTRTTTDQYTTSYQEIFVGDQPGRWRAGSVDANGGVTWSAYEFFNYKTPPPTAP